MEDMEGDKVRLTLSSLKESSILSLPLLSLVRRETYICWVLEDTFLLRRGYG